MRNLKSIFNFAAFLALLFGLQLNVSAKYFMAEVQEMGMAPVSSPCTAKPKLIFNKYNVFYTDSFTCSQVVHFGFTAINRCNPGDSSHWAKRGFTYLGKNGTKHYYRSDGKYTWKDADSISRAEGGYLPTVNDSTEQSFLLSNNAGKNVWIGLSDHKSEGNFKWSNNETLSYTAWSTNQPDGKGKPGCDQNETDYVIMQKANGLWNDRNACEKNFFFMEFDYDPSLTITQTLGLPSGSIHSEGAHKKAFTVTDQNGNSSSCWFWVFLLNNHDAVIHMNPYPKVWLDSTGNAQVLAMSLIDSVQGGCEILGAWPPDPVLYFDCSDFGTVLYSFEVYDHRERIIILSGPIGVFDSIYPVAACHDTTVYLDAKGNASIPMESVDNGSWDNCVALIPQESWFFGYADIGTNPVLFEVYDKQSNRDTCYPNVTVIDTIIPKAYHADIFANNDPGICGASINFSAPVSINPQYVLTQISGPVSGSVFPVGTTTITYKVEAPSGNSSTCSFKIIVKDVEPPSMNCQDVVARLLSHETGGRIVHYHDPGVVDNCGVASLKHISGGKSGDYFPLGVTVITWQSTDNSGNVTTCTFNLTVEPFQGKQMESHQMEDGNEGSGNEANSFMNFKANPSTLGFENEGSPSLLMYPNPAGSYLHLDLKGIKNSGTANIEIFDLTGRKMMTIQKNVDGNTKSVIDLSRFNNGQYNLRFSLGKTIFTKNLVVMH